MAESKNSNLNHCFYVTHGNRMRGPFEIRLIEAMVLAEYFPPDIAIRKTDEYHWVPLGSLAEPGSNISPGISPQKKSLMVVAGALAVAIFCLITLRLAFASTVPKAVSKAVPPKVENPPPKIEEPSHPWLSSSSVAYPQPPPVRGLVELQDIPWESVKAKSAVGEMLRRGNLSYTDDPVSNEPSSNDGMVLYKNSRGQTYRVPQVACAKLVKSKVALDIRRKIIETNKIRIEKLSAEIDRLRDLDQTGPSATENLKARVDGLNSEKDQFNRDMETFNGEVEAFDREFENVGILIP